MFERSPCALTRDFLPVWTMHALLIPLLLDLTATDVKAEIAPIGTRIESFELSNSWGGSWCLRDHGDSKLVVVVFLGADCPLAKAYAPHLNELARSFAPRGVTFVGIDANRHDSSPAIARFAKRHKMVFPVLKDSGNVIADRFGALRNPEVFVLDKQRVVRYRGRIDDKYTAGGGRKDKADRADLVCALEDLLADRPVAQPVTAVSGCLIARVDSKPPNGSITYTKHIAPVLQKHCVVCHRAGQIAPFALTSYRDAEGWSDTITEVLRQGRMPPWHANPKHGKFANDLRLTERDKQLILDWIENGCPEGNPADLPPPAAFAEGWNIPKPDVVVSIPEPFTVPAEGVIEYQYFEVDPGFREDKWIRAIEIRPGNRQVVHHCNIFLKPPGSDNAAEAGSLGSLCLAAMAPGTPPVVLPDGMAKLIPAGWRLWFVVHYTAVGSVQTDQTSVGLVFADSRTVKKEVATKLMVEPRLSIPPHAANFPVSQTWQVHKDIDLLAMFPHMHLRGKSFRYEVAYPDDSTEILLDVPRYDFNWQHRYVLAEPKRLPAGSQLTCTAHYDNSKDNLANPDPTATVRAGTQSWDEMFNGYFDVVLADQDLTLPLPWHIRLWARAQAALGSGHALLGLSVVGGFLYLRRRCRYERRV
jgi:peroxiredoxin